MDSILLGILVALAVWIFMKLRRGDSGLFSGLFPGSRAHIQPSPQQQQKQHEMPRIGTAGTITEEQIKRLKRNSFGSSKDWSFEEAALILDAVSYLRAVCAEVAGKKPPPIEIQNELLCFILEDKELRTYVRKWGQGRRDAAIEKDRPQLPHNTEFNRVAKAASRFTKP